MALQTTDLMLVYDVSASQLKKCQVGNASADIASNDLLLVERSNVKKKMTYSNWVSSAQNTDLLLVERGGVKKKVTKANYDALLGVSYTDIHSANYAINGLSLLYNQGTDNNNPYSVIEVQAEFTSSGSSDVGHLYFGHRNSATTSFLGDLPIAAIQIIQSDGSTIRETAAYVHDYNFGLGNVTQGYADWGTTHSTNTNSSTSPGTFTYNTFGTSMIKRRWGFSSGNGGTSANVGAAKGIPTATYDGAKSNILPTGSHNVAQSTVAGDGYIMVECSSSSTGDIVWFALEDSDTYYNGDRIRICYFGGGNGTSTGGGASLDIAGTQPDNTLFVRFVAE